MKAAEELVYMLQTTPPEVVRSHYVEELEKFRIEPRELIRCSLLDLSYMKKEISRNLRNIKRNKGDNCKGLYFQINPRSRWGLNIGIIPNVLEGKELTQEILFYSQIETVSCRGNNIAAELFVFSRNTPYEDIITEYLWVCTLLEVWQTIQSGELNMTVYAGIAHSNILVQLMEYEEKE